MNSQQPSANSLLERFHRAMNQHDIEAFVACFALDYDSKQPFHPTHAFVGNEQVRKNWTSMFETVPDFRGDLLRSTSDGDTIWTEWDWHGTGFHVAVAIIFGIRDERFTWGRLYMETVDVG